MMTRFNDRPLTLRAANLLTAVLTVVLCVPAPVAAERRPNVLIIMADDMGFSDVGCYGSEIQTPNLDRLARGGLRFTQFYNTARCCPTRAALLTGLYPHQAGVGHMVEDRHFDGYRGRLNDRCVTIAEALRPAGYRTMMTGKWHVGERRPHWPVDRGFDRYFGLVSGGSNYWKLDQGRVMAIDDRAITPADTELADDFYYTDAFTHYATKFLDEHAQRHRDKPFFLYLAYTAPHWPLHARPADIAKYQGKYLIGWDELRKRRHAKMVEQGLVDPKWPVTPRAPRAPAWENVPPEQKADWDLRMAVYAAQIDRMDQGIGQVVRKLEEQGQLDNTIILFLADNGGCAEIIDRGEPGTPPGPKESFLSYGVGWANASNTPFRRFKHWVHEGGIATPLIAHWPAGIRSADRGKLTHEPGHVIDLMATCLDAAGAEYPKTHNGKETIPLEGRSLLPVLKTGKREGHEFIFWEHEGHRAVRQGKWKLVAQHGRPWELYDLEADRTEMSDLAARQPEKVKELTGVWQTWADRSGVKPWRDVQAAANKKTQQQ